MAKNIEAEARKFAIFRAQVNQSKSNAAGAHGGGKREQNRKRRAEGKRQARDY
jgi:hypothetical protein